MALRARSKTKINTRRPRFALIACNENPFCMILVDRDAEPEWTAEKKGRHVARVTKDYARAILALLNRGDDNGLLNLQPYKPGKG